MAKDGGDFIASWAFYIHEIGIGALHQALLLMFKAAHTQNYCLCMAKDGGDFIASWAFYIHEIGIGALHQALLLMFPLLQASLFKDSNLRPAALTFLYIPSLDYCEIK